jgi:tetraacyldisaccharide-1-P 4'-kinase
LGKSEVALWLLAQRSMLTSRPAALLSHGYRAGHLKAPERVELARYWALSESERREALCRWGDEALMSRWRLPSEVSVWVGGSWRARWEASVSAEERFVVCDGALYHHALRPTHQLCLFDPSVRPLLWPFGGLSRPPSAFPQVSWWAHQSAHTRERAPWSAYERCAPLLAHSAYRAKRLISPEGQPLPVTELKGRLVEPWVGVARPERFLELLKRSGARLTAPVSALNHRAFSERDVRASLKRASPWRVCTFKDLARVPRGVDVYVLELELSVSDLAQGAHMTRSMRGAHA